MTKNDTADRTKMSPQRHIKVELHIVQNFPPSCLNRDDTGMPKECLFGGVRRARISSQCLKYWMRRYFEETGREIGIRTKELRDELRKMMEQAMPEEKRARLDEVIEVFLSLYYSPMETQKRAKTSVLLFVGQAEMREAAKCINEVWDTLIQEADARKVDEAARDADKNAKGRPQNQKLSTAKLDKIANVSNTLGRAQHTIDIALFGRMMASKPGQNVDGSCQVAQAISTHRVHPELDYYTAVDDVVQRRLQEAQDFFAATSDLETNDEDTDEDMDDEGTDDIGLTKDENSATGLEENDDAEDATDGAPDASAGAGMLGLIGYNSACYYRYLLLDCDELAKNLQSPSERDLEAQIRVFFEAALASIPQAKRTSMGQQAQPSFYMFVVRHQGVPASLVNAFAEPVRLDDGFEDTNSDQDMVGKSIARLDNYWSVLTRVYGKDGISGQVVEPLFHANRLVSLKDFVVKPESDDPRSTHDIALDEMVELVRQARRERQEENAGGTR